MRRFSTLTLSALVCLVAGAGARGEDEPRRVPILASAPVGLSGAGEIVRGGVPFPAKDGFTKVSDLSRVAAFRVRDPRTGEGDWTPVQWSVLSRHGGSVLEDDKPVKWALAQYPALDGTWFLRWGAPADIVRPADVAREDADTITVDTGALTFRVPKDKSFAPLQGLKVRVRDGDREVLRDAVTGSGMDIKLVLVQKALVDGKPKLVDREYRLSETIINDVAVEENGPWRSVIRLRGTFQDKEKRPLLSNFLGYTLRIWADRGSDQVRAFFTLENNGVYGPPADGNRTTTKPHWVRIRSCEMLVPTTLAAGRIAASTADGTWEVENGGKGTDFRILQQHRVVDRKWEARNFVYTVHSESALVQKKNAAGELVFAEGWPVMQRASKELHKGTRSDGGLRVDDGSIAVSAGVRHFWQNYPKAVSFDDGALNVEMWPREPGEKWPEDINPIYGDAYEFEGGRHKTYEVALTFGAASADRKTLPASVRSRERSFQNPASLVVDPGYVQSTGAVMGAFSSPDFPVANPAMTEAMRHLQRMQQGQVDVRFCDAQGADGEIPPASLHEQRETRGHALPSAIYDLDCYGFMNFGDLPHDRGYSSGHHDWVKGLMLNWLRYGKREFLDVGTEMARHRYDIDQYHCQERADPNWKWYNGFQRYELGFHGARLADFHPHGEQTACPQHTWLEGLLLHYAVTGDVRSLETARENAEAFVNYFTVSGGIDRNLVRGALEYFGQLSAMSEGVHQLLAFYEFTGERRYYDVAMQVFRNGLLKAEEYYGNRGFFEIKYSQLEVWPVIRLLQPLMTVHRLSGDPEALGLLVRCLSFLVKDAYDGGVTDDEGRYMPLTLPHKWDLEDGQLVARRWYIPYNFFTADAFAYVHVVTGEPHYLEWARRTFHDAVVFFQAPVHQFVPPDFYSRVSYTPQQYPNSETKNDAWLLTYGQWYLQLEQILARTGKQGAFTIPNEDWFTLRRRTLTTLPPRRRPSWQPWEPQVPKIWDAHDRIVGSADPRLIGIPAPPPPPVRKAEAPKSEDPVLRVAEPNYPTPKSIERKIVSMDDRDAVFAGEWITVQDGTSNNGSYRMARAGTRNATATYTIPVEREGRYFVMLFYPEVKGATRAGTVEVTSASGWDRFHVNQTEHTQRWRLIKEVSAGPKDPVVVKFSCDGVEGDLIADSIRLEPVEVLPVR